MEFDEEIKKRFKMVYVPNWFSVDLKTGVSHRKDFNIIYIFTEQIILTLCNRIYEYYTQD